MKKKTLAIVLVVCLLATALVSGTLAYFTDTEQVTNTMTVGNVEINIDEFQKVDGKWYPFKDKDFTLYPVSNGVGTTYRNKIAYTANVSPSKDDAYIRTIVLFEANGMLPSDYVNDGDTANDKCCVPGLHYNYFEDAEATSVANGKTIHGAKYTELDAKVDINGKHYWMVVFEAVDGNAIPYDEALFSLNGVYMDKNITSEQIKGWGNDGVDIIVFSQAVQTEGFKDLDGDGEIADDALNTAFGEVNESNVQKWIGADNAVINDWE